MSRFGCFNPIPERDLISDCVVSVDVPVIEGNEILDVVCPVSKFTGHRESAFKLLGKLTGAKADVLNAVLMEIPVLVSDSRLTDEDRVQTVVSRLSSGTPAEDALMAERLMADIDALGLSAKSVEQKVESIKFNASDVASESQSE